MNRSSVLLIYTGGTIGMKEDPSDRSLRPFDFESLLDEVPELRKFDMSIDTYTFDPLIDSSDIEPSMWQKLALLIQDNYDRYDGFVVLHGTDTMAYSASRAWQSRLCLQEVSCQSAACARTGARTWSLQ